MDSSVTDEAFTDYLERDWPAGLDNDGLDISQLTSFINDESSEAAAYFGAEFISSGDGRGPSYPDPSSRLTLPHPSSSHSGSSDYIHLPQHHNYHHTRLSGQLIPVNPQQQPPSANYYSPSRPPNYQQERQESLYYHHHRSDDLSNTNQASTTAPAAPARTSSSSMSIPIVAWNQRHSSAQGHPLQQQYWPGQSRTHLLYPALPGANAGHALPESPPDSGSEPPYSPPDHPNLSPQERVGLTELLRRSSNPAGVGISTSYTPQLPSHQQEQQQLQQQEQQLLQQQHDFHHRNLTYQNQQQHPIPQTTPHDNSSPGNENIQRLHLATQQQPHQQLQHSRSNGHLYQDNFAPSTSSSDSNTDNNGSGARASVGVHGGGAKEGGGSKKRKLHAAPLPPVRHGKGEVKDDPDDVSSPHKFHCPAPHMGSSPTPAPSAPICPLRTHPHSLGDSSQVPESSTRDGAGGEAPGGATGGGATSPPTMMGGCTNGAPDPPNNSLRIIDNNTRCGAISNDSESLSSLLPNSAINITRNNMNTTINNINNISLPQNDYLMSTGKSSDGNSSKVSMQDKSHSGISDSANGIVGNISGSLSSNLYSNVHAISNSSTGTPNAVTTNNSSNKSLSGSINSSGYDSASSSAGRGGPVIPYIPRGEEDDFSMDSSCTVLAGRARTLTPLLREEILAGAGPTGDPCDGGGYPDQASYQTIRFTCFQQTTWNALCDSRLVNLPSPDFTVDADKGFNFSLPDDSFVCQKKNHFQVTVQAQMSGSPHYVRSPEGAVFPILAFCIHFYGVKSEAPQHRIRVEQSQSDRSKKVFHPVPIEIRGDQPSKVTVGRMHFSETTSNNMRKKGKPNPDQRFFHLVVALEAVCGDSSYTVAARASEKIIVRASNPGQFESDVEYTFQRGSVPESVYHMGRVGINTDRPDESLTVHGNIRMTGQLLQPSDRRAKRDIKELDTQEQLRNVQNLRVVKYKYRDSFARSAGLDNVSDTGVIAQEVEKVLPDAVKRKGDVMLANGKRIDNFLLVNKDRIFMENVGAVKELCKVTGNLENRIDELERINNKISKLSQLRRHESRRSTASSLSTGTSGFSSTSPRSATSNGFKGGIVPPPKLLTARGGHRTSPPTMNREQCSSKSLQLVTIVLVCVMALCLVSMATLYIIDYHENRTSTSTTTDPTPTMESTSLSHTTSIPINFTSLTSSSSPPLPSSSTFFTTVTSAMSTSPEGGGGHTPTTSPPTISLPTSAGTDSSSSTGSSLTSLVFTTLPSYSSTVTSPPYQPVRPPVLGRPEQCVVVAPDGNQQCEVHCCQREVLLVAPSTQAPSPSSTPASTLISVTRRYRIYGSSAAAQPPGSSLDAALITNKLTTNDPDTLTDPTSAQTLTLNFKSIPSKKASSHLDHFSRLSRHRLRQQSYQPTSSRKIKQTISKRDIRDSDRRSFQVDEDEGRRRSLFEQDEASLGEKRYLRNSEESLHRQYRRYLKNHEDFLLNSFLERAQIEGEATPRLVPELRRTRGSRYDSEELDTISNSIGLDPVERRSSKTEVHEDINSANSNWTDTQNIDTNVNLTILNSEYNVTNELPEVDRIKRSIGLSAPGSSTGDANGKISLLVNPCLPALEIVELNTPITHLYCLNTSQQYFEECTNGSSANLTYGLPVSMFMQHINLTLKFVFSEPGCQNIPYYCPPQNNTNYPPLQCKSSSVPTLEGPPTVLPSNQFEMILEDVGWWEKVGYKFRIKSGHGDNHSDPCTFSEDNLGTAYTEYNFLFYRVCDA